MILTAKQNQKFPFHFLSAPPTPPAEENKKGKENFWFLHTRVRERVRGALSRITTQSERTEQFQATTHAERAKSVRILLEMGSNFFKQTPLIQKPLPQEVVFVSVDLGGIEPPSAGCKPAALPLSYRPFCL